MIHIGLCTIALHTLPVADALAIAGESGATGIELWGRDHLPDTATSHQVARVRRLADTHGICIAAYGSYARAGADDWTDTRFTEMLTCISDLGTRFIRVWAGTCPSAEASPEEWRRVHAKLQGWGDIAAERDQCIVVERHCQTLTDYGDSARRLIDSVDHLAVRLNYQVPYPAPVESYRPAEVAADLRLHLPVSAHLHIQQYNAQLSRVPIADGIIDYAAWVPLLNEAQFDGWAMLEFLPEGSSTPLAELTRQEISALTTTLAV